MIKNCIRIFWFSEIILMRKTKENYGDLLGKYLVEKISKKKVVWVFPKHFSLFNYFKPIYVTAGSILSHVNENCIVWGSGIIQSDQLVKKAKFLAVRGPQTRKRLLELGYELTEVYGDPALLLPTYYFPMILKKYKIGIVPHYNDYKEVKEWYKNEDAVKVIDLMTLDIESTTDEFLECENIISSSLHGLIVAHAYNIPAIWVKFSDKLFGDGIKFQDYFESVGINNYIPNNINRFVSEEEMLQLLNEFTNLPNEILIQKCKKDLIESCPFHYID